MLGTVGLGKVKGSQKTTLDTLWHFFGVLAADIEGPPLPRLGLFILCLPAVSLSLLDRIEP